MRFRRSVMASVVGVLFLTTVALPATGRPGNSPVFQANLTTGAELHEVVGSNANGHATFRVTDSGMSFTLKANRTSGAVWGAHIHGPAGPDANAGILVSLCGAPPPAAVATCSTGPGKLRVEGVITEDLVSGDLSLADVVALMESGQTYVNVHTDLNAAGEIRGQIR